MAKSVKPTLVEKLVIQKRLKTKYPQMFKKGWGKPKPKIKKRTDQITDQLRKAGISQSQIDRMKGKKK